MYDIDCNEYSDINLINTGIDSMEIAMIPKCSGYIWKTYNEREIVLLWSMQIPDVIYIFNPFHFNLIPISHVFYYTSSVMDIHNKLKEETDDMLVHLSKQQNLINMDSNNRMINICERIFDDMKRNEHNTHCNEATIWNAMIYVYGTNGNIIKVKEIFNELIQILIFKAQLIIIKLKHNIIRIIT